ncbi:hypothetical protein DRO42_01935 [Candidatus Bathyarchaeota archaeon]|nr:MAG: hypothetical protein DRO42_01935 [Candidatus Bathyarchaeota archaeon]
MTKNRLLLILTLLVASSLLLTSVSTAVAAEPAYKPYGGTLIAPLPSDPSELSVFLRASTWSFVFLDPIYDPLYMLDPDNIPVPWLAKSAEVDSTGKVWTIELLDNATWHDGTPFTAEDVKFTFEHAKDAGYPRWSEVADYVDHVEVVDTYTCKIYLTEVYVDFISEILTYPIVPKHIWESIVTQPDFDPFTYVPPIEVLKVGNGPFILDHYTETVEAEYVANENFARGRPYIDKLLMPIITSPDAMLLALKAGEIDVHTWTVPLEALPSLITDPNIGVHIYKSGTMYHWGFNTMIMPFKDKRFRHVLAHCVDKDEIVSRLLYGYGRPGRFGVYPPTEMWPWWLNEDPKCGVYGYEFNLTLAAQMLDDMGWTDTDGDGIREYIDPDTGERVNIEFDIGPPIYDPVRVRAAEMIQEWLAEIDIKATVQYNDWPTTWSKITAEWDSPHKLDTWLLGSGLGVGSPDILRFRLHSSKTPNPNYYYFLNATFDELAERQAVTIDQDERAEIIKQMQEILAEEVPLIVLYHRNFPSVYRTDRFAGWVKPIQDGVNNQWSWMSVYLKELAVLKDINVVLEEFPSEVEKDATITFRVKLTDDDGNPLSGVDARLLIEGMAEPVKLDEVSTGVYSTSVETTGWTTGSYELSVQYTKDGFNDAITTLTFKIVEPEAPPPPSFWELYGTTVTGVVVLLAIIAVIAVYFISKKS